jgi:hypothetical protein
MFSMLTRLGLLSTLGVGSAVAFFGGDRVKLYYENAKESVISAIDEAQGMEAKLGLIRTQINSLDKEERRLKSDAIRNNIDVDSLRSDIEARRASLAKQADLLDRVSKMLADGSAQYSIAGRAYDRAAVERDAAEKLAVFTVQKDTLANLEETLATKEKAQLMAAENVGRAAALRVELKAQLSLLEAKLDKYRAKQNFAATVEEVVDTGDIDSALTRAKEMMRDFSKDLEVKDRMLDEQLKGAEAQPTTGISYDDSAVSSADLAARIRAALEGRTSDEVAVTFHAARTDVTVH